MTSSTGIEIEEKPVPRAVGGRRGDEGTEAEGMRASGAEVGAVVDNVAVEARAGTGEGGGESKGERGETEAKAWNRDGGGSENGGDHVHQDGRRRRGRVCGGR